jgi:hypothetical protein
VRDFQKQRVYDWEREVIQRCSHQTVQFRDAQAFIDGVFLKHGWLYPPKAKKIAKQTRRAWATGNRAEINLPEVIPAWVILHELAHTLTMTEHEGSEGHGPDFVGIYIKLLDTVLHIPVPMSMYTLTKNNIKFNLGARPRWEK